MAFKKGHKPSNGFDKDPERARAAGRKSQTATQDLRAARRMAALEFEDIVYKYMRSPVAELKAMMTDPKTPAVELVVIKLLVMSIQNGDISRFNLLLERTIGKVQEKIKLEGTMTNRTLHDQIVDEIEKNELTNT